MYPFERFSENAKRVLTLSQEQAERHGQHYIGTEHLLLGLVLEDSGIAGTALRSLGVDYDSVWAAIAKVLEKRPEHVLQQIIPTSRVKRIIELAFGEALTGSSSVVGTDHLLIALLREGEGIGAQVLKARGLGLIPVSAEIARLRADGIIEEAGATSRRVVRMRHLDVADSQQRSIGVDIVFPSEYPKEDEEGVVVRIRQAVEGSET